ncbi:MAG: HAD family acid phosphatase [Allosphingosinicella sp.]
MRRTLPLALLLALGACATAPAAEAPPAPAPAAPAAAAEAEVPATMQWLYGSGEGGAASIQAWHGFRDYVLEAARSRPASSVVLAEGSTLTAARFVPCGDKPPAVILDADETVIQNLGFEYALARRGKDYDRDLHRKWMAEGVKELAPMPGAVTALDAVRAAGVKVLFNTNRDGEFAANAEEALNAAGLGPAVHLDTLFLRGDPPGDREKDGRRALLAERYCVLAMAGDQLGDFSDLFNARGLAVAERRRAATTLPFARLWGNGWFLLSNPVYGPGLRGGFDDVFPAGTRWADPQGGQD